MLLVGDAAKRGWSVISNRALEGVAWGAFIMLIGLGWWAGDYYEADSGPYIALGAGAILIVLNAIRASAGIRVSKFSLFIGLVAFAIGSAGILGYSLQLVPTIMILIGLFIIASALQKMAK